ncbi:MAG TPA: thiamine pyrophosphate-dependent dehydrogenase E1 component subunit alpha [Caulobacteraceae bacterium]|jgi:pyruvate dehydrogenase E1 component alpha subunit|nr:thiamine pyrophosphate-dependent dehydrogenase E1 component subunit alpha [Caulobacteraceae bacterium]
MDPLATLKSMLLIRRFEAALNTRPDHGFQLYSSGAEAVAVGVCAALRPGDQLLSSGRSIGPALARGIDPRLVMAELLGKTAGPARGKGGRGHLAKPDQGFFGAHPVVAGNISIAAGAALAAQLEAKGRMVACIFGDGASGAGALHETLNIAALWRLPLLLVCDNNGLSVSTPREAALAPARLSDLAAPFGVPAASVDGTDVEAVQRQTETFAVRVRAGDGPAFLECRSERFFSHSTATRETRSGAVMRGVLERCPIRKYAAKLQAVDTLDAAGVARIEAETEAVVAEALAFADASPYPDPAEALRDVV